MTGNRSFFLELTKCSSEHVMFGDGAKDKIVAKGNIVKQDLSCLKDVRYIKGLKANLISVSQLCDQGYTINFSKEECIITDINKNVFMNGIRQIDNCYHWLSKNNHSYHLSKEYQTHC